MRGVARFITGILAAGALLVGVGVPAAAAESERLVFSAARDESAELHDLYSVTPTGHDMRVVTATPALSERGTAASADGRLLAFVGYDENGSDELYTVRPDGTGFRQVTQSPDEVMDEPALSPDGSKIAYGRSVPYGPWEYESTWDLYVADVDGSNERRLTTGARAEYPTWSPDGRMLAYVGWEGSSDGRTGGWSLYTFDLASGERRRVTDGGTFHEGLAGGGTFHSWPTWCPSGDRIVFSVVVDGYAGAPWAGVRDADLYSVAPDGSNLEQLTSGAHGDIDPACSTDGRRIAFQRWPLISVGAGPSDELAGGLHVLDLVDRTVTRVTLPSWAAAADVEPAWVLASAVEGALAVPSVAPAVPAPASSRQTAGGRAIVLGRRLRLSRGGVVRITLRCLATAPCGGRLSLHGLGRRLGGARYTVPGGVMRRVTIELAPRVRRALRTRGRVSIRIVGDGALPARTMPLVARR